MRLLGLESPGAAFQSLPRSSLQPVNRRKTTGRLAAMDLDAMPELAKRAPLRALRVRKRKKSAAPSLSRASPEGPLQWEETDSWYLGKMRLESWRQMVGYGLTSPRGTVQEDPQVSSPLVEETIGN